jgi:SAM-dependent methyltransferase
MLDFGAGRGALVELNFQNEVAYVCGVDVDDAVKKNPFLHEAGIIENNVIPYPDSHFDLVVSSYVLEHLEHPETSFAEIHRVLKPDGLFIARTPNKHHYVPLIASMTPQWFHEYVNVKRGRAAVDTFPTFYRANSPRAIHRCAERAGFLVREIDLYEGRPEYLRLSLPTYLTGLAYERLVNAFDFLSMFRVGMTATLQKAASASHR